MKCDELYSCLKEHYSEKEFPALHAQYQSWKSVRPFSGKRILDATPLFRNTMAKYLALIAGGAELAVAVDPRIPHDPAVAEMLPRFGIEVLSPVPETERFDAVLDCAGIHAAIPSEYGYVELTRSGLVRYETCSQPVFLADEGRIKRIETSLGTGDGFYRGMKHFGYGDFAGKKIVVFGFGKVGSGAVLAALSHGASVTVVDDLRRVLLPPGVAGAPLDDPEAIERAVRSAWCVVTATGIRHALCGKFDLNILRDSEALIANLGVEDEFGDAIPAERVLNRKMPLNFVLEEPTHLKYIDPTMALDNYGALLLISGKLGNGLTRPDAETEERILETVRKAGVITAELKKLEGFSV